MRENCWQKHLSGVFFVSTFYYNNYSSYNMIQTKYFVNSFAKAGYCCVSGVIVISGALALGIHAAGEAAQPIVKLTKALLAVVFKVMDAILW